MRACSIGRTNSGRSSFGRAGLRLASCAGSPFFLDVEAFVELVGERVSGDLVVPPNGPSGATLTGPAPTQPPVDNVPEAPENGGGEEGGVGGENDPEVPGGEIPGVPEMSEMPLVPADNPNLTTGETGTGTA